jgi:hypothetical protein
VKKALDRMNFEVARMSDPEDQNYMEDDPFEFEVGYFWGFVETRDYMRARHQYAQRLIELDTLTGVREALANYLDMLRLCRGDNMGLRSAIPGLFLRLGGPEDVQRCYDFVKWWALVGEDPNYDWGNPEEPYLDIKDADPCEPLSALKPLSVGRVELSHMLALLFIKVRLYREATAFRDAVLGLALSFERLPAASGLRARDVLSLVCGFLAPAYRPFAEVVSAGGVAALLRLRQTLRLQIAEMLSVLEKNSCKEFFSLLFNPDSYMRCPMPPYYGRKSKEEAILMLREYYRVLHEKDGSRESKDLDVIKEIMASRP